MFSKPTEGLGASWYNSLFFGPDQKHLEVLCCFLKVTLGITNRKAEEGWTSPIKGVTGICPRGSTVGMNVNGTLNTCLLRGPGLETQLIKVVILIKSNV